MSQEWYYSVEGDRQGPVSAQELKKLVEAGSIKASDLVWKDGMADWVPAKTIKGLFAAGASSGGTPAASAPTKTAEPKEAADDIAEDDRPKKRREVAKRDDDEEDEPRPKKRRDEDDDDEPRPKKRRKSGGIPDDVGSKKMTAGLLGILLNAWGIHKFYLGMNGAGLTMLLVSLLTCGLGAIVMWPIGLIEGIIYLTKSDEEFYETYIVGKKAWF